MPKRVTADFLRSWDPDLLITVHNINRIRTNILEEIKSFLDEDGKYEIVYGRYRGQLCIFLKQRIVVA